MIGDQLNMVKVSALVRRRIATKFLTLALDGGEWSVSRPGRLTPKRKRPRYPTGLEAGWAPEPV
jgi:hypothetical protein